MSALSRFERFMEQLVEGSVARLFRSPIQPVELAKRLEKAMESNQMMSARRILVPNVYRIELNPEDWIAFQPMRAEIEGELASYLTELALERSFTLLGSPQVTLVQNPAVALRGVRVESETVESAVSAGETQMMPTPVVTPQQNAVARASLLIPSPSGSQTIPLAATVVRLGRSFDNDIVLDDKRVSRYHALLRYQVRQFWVIDQNSMNGTFVNGARITETPIQDGDVVSLGGLELGFRMG